MKEMNEISMGALVNKKKDKFIHIVFINKSNILSTTNKVYVDKVELFSFKKRTMLGQIYNLFKKRR